MNGTNGFQWKERRWYADGAPEGKVWSVREMFCYGVDLGRFIPHLQAVAEGLERPYFTDCDLTNYDWEDDDDRGMFVVGLRPMTPSDKTQAQLDAEFKESTEREQLKTLLAKYGPPDEGRDDQSTERGDG